MDEKNERVEGDGSAEEIEGTESIEPIEEYVAPELNACIFRVGDQEFSIELDYLKEIAELSEVVPLPLSPPYIEGITHLRGVAIPVVNIAVLRDIPEEKATYRWLIVLEVGRFPLAIVVNDMPDLSADFRGEQINVTEFFETYRVR